MTRARCGGVEACGGRRAWRCRAWTRSAAAGVEEEEARPRRGHGEEEEGNEPMVGWAVG